MKSRMSLIFAALVVLLVTMIWVVRDRAITADLTAAPAMSTAPTAAPTITPVPTIAIQVQTDPAAGSNPAVVTATPPIPDVELPRAQSRPLVHIATDGTINYTARTGDTVSELAVALLGSDSKHNRDAVIAANASLQVNPDRVLDGYTYSIQPSADPTVQSLNPSPASATDANAAVVPSHPPVTVDAPTDAAAPTAAPLTADVTTDVTTDAAADQKSDSERKLKYTAQPGDSVAVLAANLLGGDTKTNREAIISGNASLQRDPDRLVAGKTYNITTTNGLAADPAGVKTVVPTTQPDADDAVRLGAGRVLRYTAQAGDTVSKLAIVLLGSDTKANRDAIISSNRSLKQDPDHLVAGQTYWIAAPTPAPIADTTTP